MKNMYTSKKGAFVFCFLLSFFSFNAFTQVGIGTTTPNSEALLEIGDAINNTKGLLLPRVNLIGTANASPLSGNIMGMIVYNKNTAGDVTPGLYYNSGTAWVRLEGSAAVAEPPVDSVTLATDVLLSGSTFTNVSGMSLTFIARKTEAVVNFTVSGLGYTGSLTFASFRLYNSTTASVIGGTNSSAQSLWKSSGNTYSITTWSASFSKRITGLTIGTSYTIVLQGKTTNILGTDGVAIYPLTYPDTSHASLSILQ